MKRSVSGSSLTDSIPVAGTKRSVRDRLGSNVDGSLSHGSLHNNKRYALRYFENHILSAVEKLLFC